MRALPLRRPLPLFRRIRIAILLYILVFVAAGHWLTQARSTDWDGTLWVAVYPVVGDGSRAAAEAAAALDRSDFERVESFFASEAGRYGIALERPVRFDVAAPSEIGPPRPPASGGVVDAIAFSLRLRLAALRAGWRSDLPRADITLFAVLHDGAGGETLDRSVGLQKGMVAVANLFAERTAAGTNSLVVAHELLHTLGATDKYRAADNTPVFPQGYADPAELMAGRIALSERSAVMPRGLDEVVIGPATAVEIGWPDGSAAR